MTSIDKYYVRGSNLVQTVQNMECRRRMQSRNCTVIIRWLNNRTNTNIAYNMTKGIPFMMESKFLVNYSKVTFKMKGIQITDYHCQFNLLSIMKCAR